MRKLLRLMFLLLTMLAVGGLCEWRSADGWLSTASAKPPGKKGGPKGRGKGKDALQKAYDALSDVAARLDAGRARAPRELTKLYDRARDLYRDAERAARDDAERRADELAIAAHDAARGLLHALRAETASDDRLPPPRRNEDELDDLLRRTRDRLDDFADSTPRGPGREFYDAARRFYDRARRAGHEDKERAVQWARAAEAWTHVGEHLSRAEDPDVRRRPPPPPPPD